MKTIVSRTSGLNYRSDSVMGTFYRLLRNRCFYDRFALIAQHELLRKKGFIRNVTSVNEGLLIQNRKENHKIPIDLLTIPAASRYPAVSSLEAYPTPAH